MYVFSYGTLSDKFPELVIKDIQDAHLVGCYILEHSSMFPELRKGGFSNVIKGVLLKVDEKSLSKIDEYESNGELYTRELVEVFTENGSVQAWVYFSNKI